MENNNNFKELISDKEFLEKILQMETGEEVQNAFKEKNVELNSEEIEEFAKVLVELMESNKKITESELETVVGGKKIFRHFKEHNGKLFMPPIQKLSDKPHKMGLWLKKYFRK